MTFMDDFSEFNTGTYLVTRRGAGFYSGGVWVPAAVSTLNITAGVQPMSGDDLKVMPAGRHAENTLKLYTETKLFREDPLRAQAADHVTIRGQLWEVVNVAQWDFCGDTHYRAYVALVVDQANESGAGPAGGGGS